MDDYLRNSLDGLGRAWNDLNMGLAETIHGAPQRYEHGGLEEAILGSPAWEAYRAASEARVLPGKTRRYADGGPALPMRLPYGQRWNEETGRLDSPQSKDIGFYGPLKNADHIVSEYSSDADIGSYPMVAPGMSREQLAEVLTAERFGARPSRATEDFALRQAQERIAAGKSPFWDQRTDPYPAWSPEQEWPQPRIGYADGGAIDIPSYAKPAPPSEWAGQIGDAAKAFGNTVLRSAPRPIEDAERLARQLRGGDYLGAFETGAAAMPTQGIFAGPKALTADRDALQMAYRMADQGADNAAIRDATKWFQGADGKWRFEIPDYDSRFLPQGRDMVEHVGARLDHPALYKAYPDAYKIELWDRMALSDPRGGQASYSPPMFKGDPMSDAQITLKGTRDPRSSILHELQHAIQNEEGFAVGANTDVMRVGDPAWQLYQDRLKAMVTPPSPAEFAKNWGGSIDESLPDYKNYVAQLEHYRRHGVPEMLDREAQKSAIREAYQRSAGEVEARNVQRRRDMNPFQLGQVHPWDTQDIPTEQQFLRFRSSGGPVEDALRLARNY